MEHKTKLSRTSHLNCDEIARLMQESRESTRELIGLAVSESDLRREPAPEFRPILWHLGHVGAFEEYWILGQVLGDPPISAGYNRIFDPINTPREDLGRLPPIPEIERHLDRVRSRVLTFLAGLRPGHSDPLVRDLYVFNLVIEHEYQHQETVAYLLQMLDPDLKRRPRDFAFREDSLQGMRRRPAVLAGPMASVLGGPFEMGSPGCPFAYDNEQPPHTVELADFRVDRCPVTNAEFVEFIEAGGYRTRSLWSQQGWSWKVENEIHHPLYWAARGEGDGSAAEKWNVREMFETGSLVPDFPVTGVSWHEAEAYARFVGKRLPAEAEWEKAASWDPERLTRRRFSWGDDEPRPDLANFNSHYWGPSPVAAFPSGASSYGCFDMTGNVWEWTSTTFAGYPGFRAYPYPEYSELWFDGDHRVLKGGSWMTRPPLLRCSFRNFFRPRFRAAFAGFRCAAD